MRYRSTRNDPREVTLSEALSAGIAPDGGLYVPVDPPRFAPDAFDGLTTLPEIAHRLLGPYFVGDRLERELGEICEDALDLPVPLRPLDGSTWLLELFHGPTAAFKDFGARFLASATSRLQAGEDRPLTILVATSGDTGGAVAAAFHGRPGVEVVVLYPEGRVSPRQAHQLACWGGNVRTLAVDGDFDACQALVKQAFADPVCRELARLSSANSINVGRLLPQMAYHAHAALQVRGAAFVIPTGNLGNALAAVWARGAGLPISDIVLATNANDTLPRFQATGELDPRPTIPTVANAMDVSRPSNLERLQARRGPLWDGLFAVSVPDATVRDVLTDAPGRWGMAVCPHTAIALRARQATALPAVVVATAHPAKFDTIVEPCVGHEVPVPPSLAAMLARPRVERRVPATLDALRQVLSGG